MLVLLASTFAVASVRASGSSTGLESLTAMSYRGTTTITDSTTTDSSIGSGTTLENSPAPDLAQLAPNNGLGSSKVPSAHVPTPSGNSLAKSNPGFFGFNGLTHRDQRLAGTGSYVNTQFSLEPPDQGLCASSNFLVETVNTALAVYSSAGARLKGPTAINQFFGLKPEVIRASPPVFGDFASDPRCYHDPTTDAWYFTVLQIDTNPSTGAFGPRSHLELAVSTTGDPAGVWNLFELDVTDDGAGGTPSHAGCPCFGDQPLIGADANGFYVSTNEFSISLLNGQGGTYVGAQLYAMSKTILAAGALPTVVQINAAGTLSSFGGIDFSVQPSTTPPGGSYATNTEFLLSTPDILNLLTNRLALWALTGTSSLNSATPNLTLTVTIVGSEVYGVPPNSEQKDGFRPLGTVVIPALGGNPGKLELLQTNDHRMQQLVYADGKLWSAVTTAVAFKNSPIQAGIAFFILSPSLAGGTLTGSMVKQGYVAVVGESVFFPSIGVNSAGKGVMTFTLAGPDFFPSAAYTTIDAVNGAGAIHTAAPGALPEDGFTGYLFFGASNRAARWGDYSAAVAAPNGSIWLAVEYIPNLQRTQNANWGTFISNVTQ